MSNQFIHLNLHTEFSLVDGIVRLKPLIKSIQESEMPAIAITDQSNLYALVKLYQACLGAGIKPVLGADLWLKNEDDAVKPFRLLVLCKNNEGYLNLKKLITQSYLHGQHLGKAMIEGSWLADASTGLIALIGKESDVGVLLHEDKQTEAEQALKFYQNLFPESLYLELQRTSRVGDERFLHQAVDIAGRLNIPVVASNAVRFLKKDDFSAHEARVCVNQGRVLGDKKRPRDYSEEQYLKSQSEMKALFADIPEAIENSVEIAKRCNVTLHLGENFLPDFPIPDGMSMDDYFRKLSHDGLNKRFIQLFGENCLEDSHFQDKIKEYRERLDIELDVIIQMGFPGYFLIVADFIQWSKENDVPVGPGRGSGAGSLVAYAMTITDLDPLEYDLLFERFLNPERVSMPDFDIDFCMDGRDKVIQYVADTYGRDRVSQIITFGSMAAKAAIRDVGRVQGQGYGFVDSLAKLIPMDIGITISQALEQEEELQRRYETDEAVKDLIDMALALEGITKNVGKHAGGVVISPSDINDFSPVYCEEDSKSIVTQYDKNDVETVGLVKFDFLGLKTLTVIDWALKIINARKEKMGEAVIDIAQIDLTDRASFNTLKASDTTAVFQLESRGMKDLIKRLQPDCFEDIVALVALFRPGPLQSGMVDDFIDRKHGRQKVEYPHPSLEPILQPTYGTILYQEQVMQISQVLAGYTLGGADLLRRAMGKKKPEVMAEQRSIFEDGSVENGVDKEIATHIFDQMEKFAAYGFNKSHSAAYALVSYQTLWLKTHYVESFMAAVLSADMDNTEKVVVVIEECRDANLKVTTPNVNLSEYKFSVSDKDEVVFGLGAIKGVGEGAIESIIEGRKTGGVYNDLQDFCNRVDLRRCNKRVMETLAKAGALDDFGCTRATLLNAIPEATKAAEQFSKAQAVGQDDLFGGDFFDTGALDSTSDNAASSFEQLPEWPEDERLRLEKETLGLYLTGHPIEQYLTELRHFTTHKLMELNPDKKQNIVIAGLIIAMRTMNTKRGDKMAFVTIDDRSGRQEIALFADKYEMYKDILIKDSIIVLSGELGLDHYSGNARVNVDTIYDLDGARNRYARRLAIDINYHQIDEAFIENFKEVITPFREGGECPIVCNYRGEKAQTMINLSNDWNVRLTKELLSRIDKLTQHQSKIMYR
ncbi:MAG: DNA polymerase III subunit alpha [gamma proteobacterium symbiont of Bathyaustriella thionipta]|nr:DNA polymerase III subunit alpha [gamma proteobacterium symbiont of Bathyaustriella thionipta]MCU7948572.1 DNA polymerase III subunit alpha [gamma proteobacterium symbiont of Bathyaustriella thionipta]MCU7953307.1 DNA polymerase III subunit alpha [gamma proteobacterium symbiont of Bathyaustriella thionipta]MCU7955078.1 DNA polymerase III subunit alpha [gamma proteobacterium symbiont of Bathyaustriella thionipta]MCU7966994.1 DNA polymerase III subunit alpha [gamma proteobacterium symbiont of 